MMKLTSPAVAGSIPLCKSSTIIAVPPGFEYLRVFGSNGVSVNHCGFISSGCLWCHGVSANYDSNV